MTPVVPPLLFMNIAMHLNEWTIYRKLLDCEYMIQAKWKTKYWARPNNIIGVRNYHSLSELTMIHLNTSQFINHKAKITTIKLYHINKNAKSFSDISFFFFLSFFLFLLSWIIMIIYHFCCKISVLSQCWKLLQYYCNSEFLLGVLLACMCALSILFHSGLHLRVAVQLLSNLGHRCNRYLSAC